ncbi:MAG: serine/threonine protein kinase [Myxococcales bacterium]|nr:serine/threonine protein kinase [Myxococcales bacterium]
MLRTPRTTRPQPSLPSPCCGPWPMSPDAPWPKWARRPMQPTQTWGRDMTASVRREFRFTTQASAEATWRALSDTDRINRVSGFGMRFALERSADGTLERRGTLRRYGLTLRWLELQAIYDAPHQFRIERQVDNGPVRSMVTSCTITPRPGGPDAGTDIEYVLEVEPRSALLRPLVEIDIGGTLARRLRQTLANVVRALDQGLDPPDQTPPALGEAALARLDAGLESVRPRRVGEELRALVLDAPLIAQDRIQPLRLARQWGVTDDEALRGMLGAVHAGVLVMQWELLCPSCRLPTDRSARQLPAPGQRHCLSCDVAFDATFPDAVAVTFRLAPAIRTFDVPIDCLSSPARVPHLVAQAVVAPGAELDWRLALLDGTYRIRSWPALEPASLVVRRDLTAQSLTVTAGPHAIHPPVLRSAPGSVALVVVNRLERPLRVVVERRWLPAWTLTAARLLELPEAAELLPVEALAVGTQVASGVYAVLAVQILRGGVAAEHAVRAALQDNGALRTQVGNGALVATYAGPDAALAAAASLQGALFLTGAVGSGVVIETQTPGGFALGGAALERTLREARAGEPGDISVVAGVQLDPAVARAEAAGTVRTWPPLRPECGVRLEFVGRSSEVVRLPCMPPGEPRAGEVVDARYELGERLGRGAYGLVHDARDRRTGGAVVLKLLHPDLADDPAQVQRFFNEGRLLARLDHPNVVRVLNWGLGDDGRLYVALERLRGRELTVLLREEGVLDPVRTLRLADGVLRGLEAAHQAGVVHRDVKPSNLFLVQEPGGELLKLLDFGIAVDDSGRTIQADEGAAIIGTPWYMAPEQVEGKPVDGRTDLYALALVLYECLSGRLPFEAATPVAVLFARTYTEPAALGESIDATLLPAGLEVALMQALAMDPDRRWAGAAAMRAALREVLDACRPREDELRRAWSQLRPAAAAKQRHVKTVTG